MTKQEKAKARIAARMDRHTKESDETSAAPWLGDQGVPDELKREFYAFLNKHKRLPETVFGAFGESAGRNGFVQKIVYRDEEGYYTKVFSNDPWQRTGKEGWFPDEDGVFVKLFGVSYLFKGNLPQASVFGMEQAKSNLFQVPMNIPLFMKLGLVMDFLFRRRKFWAFVDWYLEEINHKTLRHYQIPPEQYNTFARELFGAAIDVL